MTIILTIDFSPWSAYSGGAQRSTHNLAKALCRRGHDVAVVYTKPPWECIAYPGDLPYDVHWATFFDLRSRRQAPLRPLNALSVARVVQGLLERKGLAVVHSNGEEGGMLHRLRRRYRFGFVATPRHPRYPALLLDHDRRSPWQTARLALTEGKYLMQGRAVRHADLCVPPSAFAADLVCRAFDLDPSRIRVIPNGVPEEVLAYHHDPRALQDGPLVFFGRFDRTKGVDTLVDALGLLGSRAPRTLIIGRGPERAALLRRIHSLGLQEQVTVLEWMSSEVLARTLTTARMVVLPSREENFSLALLSAMAVGVPVISTRVGGSPEIVRHEQTGLLVEADRPPLLARAIERLLDQPALAQDVGQAGRTYVRTHLTWDHVAASFEALYRALPALKGARHPGPRDAAAPAPIDAGETHP